MAEVLTNPNIAPSVSPEQNGSPDGSLTYRERLRRGIGRMAEGVMSFADLAAGISLARDDLRLTRSAMNTLDEPYDGLIGRQAQADHISMGLESDIILDFRRDAQQAGYRDVDAMPETERSEVARLAAEQRRSELSDELAANHPEWTQDDLESAVATRVGDIATLLGMSPEQRDAYLAAQLEYHELRTAVPEIQAELSELRAERSERLSRLGRTALQGVLGFAGRVRDLPNALSARAMVAGMSISDRIRNSSPEGRRTVIGTAAGLAVAGLATYIAYRAGHAPSGNASYTLASSSSPLIPTGVGSAEIPTGVGSAQLPSGVGEYTIPTGVGVNVDPSLPTGVGVNLDPSTDPSVPTGVGVSTEAIPTGVGVQESLPTGVGSETSPLPTGVGVDTGESLAKAQSSSELFGGNGVVESWPAKIRVSEWNSQTLDGSLTGISRQMLVRSGVSNPSADQINTLVESLRPQAQSNGWLLKGQELDLRPATRALKSLLKN